MKTEKTRQHNVMFVILEPEWGCCGHRRPHRGHGATPSAATCSGPPSRRERLAQGRLREAPGDARARRGARSDPGRRGRRGDEGAGARARRHPLHRRLPAAHRPHRGEARFLFRAQTARAAAGQVLRQGSSSRTSPTPPHSPPAASATPSRRAATPPGTRPAPPHPRDPERRAALHPDRVWSWTGEALDMKTPLLARWTRSPGAAIRALKLLGDEYSNSLHDDRRRAGVLPDRRAILLCPPRPAH